MANKVCTFFGQSTQEVSLRVDSSFNHRLSGNAAGCWGMWCPSLGFCGQQHARHRFAVSGAAGGSLGVGSFPFFSITCLSNKEFAVLHCSNVTSCMHTQTHRHTNTHAQACPHNYNHTHTQTQTQTQAHTHKQHTHTLTNKHKHKPKQHTVSHTRAHPHARTSMHTSTHAHSRFEGCSSFGKRAYRLGFAINPVEFWSQTGWCLELNPLSFRKLTGPWKVGPYIMPPLTLPCDAVMLACFLIRGTPACGGAVGYTSRASLFRAGLASQISVLTGGLWAA